MPPLQPPSPEFLASEEGKALVARLDAVVEKHRPAMDAVIAAAAAYRKDALATLNSITDKALRESVEAATGFTLPVRIVLPIRGAG